MKGGTSVLAEQNVSIFSCFQHLCVASRAAVYRTLFNCTLEVLEYKDKPISELALSLANYIIQVIHQELKLNFTLPRYCKNFCETDQIHSSSFFPMFEA